MDESAKVFAPELSPAGSRKWIGRLVVAVVLGAAIWNFVASLTVNLIVPGLARVMETDPQSALYLGKGDINVAALFISLLELCFALITAFALSAIFDRAPRAARRKPVAVPTRAAAPSIAPPSISSSPQKPPVERKEPAPAISQLIPAAPPPPANAPERVAPQPAAAQPAPAPTAAAPAKPSKPAKPKRVYYNIVGERIEEDDE